MKLNRNFSFMIWRSAKQSLPDEGQEVVIKYKGGCRLAIFDAADLAFIVNVGPDIKLGKSDIQWAESKVPVSGKVRQRV